jgi:lipopolysaccharide biosynthesis protein
MRRVIFYLFYDPRGQVDDYVIHKLEALRSHAEHIFVVSNSPLLPESAARLAQVADTVWERENVGFDVWAYKQALEQFGRERLADYDELILMNYTFFGPVGSFDPMFADMDADDQIDFWGVTEHAEVVHNEKSRGVHLEAHIQSHWISVRRSMFTSAAFEAYWDEMPMITSYDDSIRRHEARFTEHFERAGFRRRVAFPESDYPSQHPIMDNATMMIADGCPIVKRRTFFHDPLYLERRAILGRDLFAMVEDRGYPVDMLLSNLARTSRPRDLATNLGLLDVLPDHDLGYDPDHPLRIVAVAHIYYVDMTEELVERFRMLPGRFDLVVTTTDHARRDQIVEILAGLGIEADVRVVESNRGRDISAFFIGCRDIIQGDDYDLIVKLHSKRSPQDDHNLGELFKRHLFENLLASPGHGANVVRLFQRYPSLGIVIPPVIHLGYPTLGHGWFLNKQPARLQAERTGIDVPFDDHTPLAAYGSMFIARPAALRPILRGGYEYDEFPGDGEYKDGTLAHALERLVVYGALSEGFHARQVLNGAFASIYYSYLEYKLQAVSHHLPAHTREQIAYIRKLKAIADRARRARKRPIKPAEALAAVDTLPPMTVIKAAASRGYPRSSRIARWPYRSARSTARLLRRSGRRG